MKPVGDSLARLRERQVIKTLVLYVAVGWGFYEIASEVLSRFGFADSIITLLLIFLLLGLPAALFLSWYFDVDRRGMRSEVPMRRTDWLIVTASLLLPVVGVVVAKPWVEGQPAGFQENTVAVLPFSNFSGDPSLEYLADGVAEEIITALTAMRPLDVSALTQSFQYRDTDMDARQVGRELGVAWIVRGSVRVSGQLLRFSATIVDARSGSTVWSESAEVTQLNLFPGQERLSSAVAAALASEIGVEVPEATAAVAPAPEAYDLYLRGRHIWHRRGTADLEPAVSMLAEATRIDPDFAKAWSGLASAYLTWPSYSPKGYATWYAAEDAARKALTLDPKLPEPYAVLASFAEEKQQWVEADEHHRQALILDPKSATANYWYGEYLSKVGRYGDSVRYMLRAMELDPTYEVPRTDIAFSFLTFGDIARGLAQLEATWEAGFRSNQTWMGLLIARVVQDDHAAAREWVATSSLDESSKALLIRFVDQQSGLPDDSLVADLFSSIDNGLDYRLVMWAASRAGGEEEVIDFATARVVAGQSLDPRPLWGIGIRLYEHSGFTALVERLGLADLWTVTRWGDICRPAEPAFVCDGHTLTPDALRAVLDEIS